MATLDAYNLPLPESATGAGILTLTDTYTCSYAEEYINDPIVSGSASYKLNYGGGSFVTHDITCTGYNQQTTHVRRALYMGTVSYTGQTVEWPTATAQNLNQAITFKIDEVGHSSTTSEYFFAPAVAYTMLDECIVWFSTNIPIFENQATAALYLAAATDSERRLLLRQAINFSDPSELEEEEVYEVTTIARNYTVDEFGNMTENEALGEVFRGFRIKSKYKASLYKITGISDGILKYGIKFHDATACYYSTDYGDTWQMVQGAPTTLPFNFTYRPYETDDGTGTFWAAVGDITSNMLEFDNEEDANEYNSGASDGRKASNYNQVMNGDFNNPTGEEDEETEFGEVYTRGFFSQQYIMDATSLAALANDLFDTSIGGIWEAIKKGLDMYGDNPIEAVMGLSFWPVNLATVFSGAMSTNKIWFGGYDWTVSAGSALKLLYPNGYKSLGSVAIRRTFRNWRDYSPYTRLYVSLPYVGVYELDLTRYYDKNVEVRYFFDTRSNGCIACLIADGHLMDYFNGQMGVTMPITLTDYAGYANSQIATLLGGAALAGVAAGGLAAGVVGVGGMAAGLAGTAIGSTGLAGAAAAAGAGVGFAGAAGLAVGGGAVAGTAIGAKNVYGLSQNNKNKYNVTKGGSSSMINEYLPQYVEFIFEIQEDCAPDNYGQQYGYPSMKSGSVGSFQGFLKCQSVKLDCGVATENEKNAIKTMLLNGIYI